MKISTLKASLRTDLQVQLPTRPAVDLIRVVRFQRRFRLAIMACKLAKGTGPTSARAVEHAGPQGLQAPHGMVPRRFDLKMKRCHIVEETCVYEVVGVSAPSPRNASPHG